jgi:antitoxin MazE
MRTHIGRWNNSLALRVPRHMAEALALREGGLVELEIEDNRLVVRAKPTAPDLAALLAGITPDNLPDEIFDDEPAGRERL